MVHTSIWPIANPWPELARRFGQSSDGVVRVQQPDPLQQGLEARLASERIEYRFHAEKPRQPFALIGRQL